MYRVLSDSNRLIVIRAGPAKNEVACCVPPNVWCESPQWVVDHLINEGFEVEVTYVSDGK